MITVITIGTVWCRCNAVNFLKNIHKRHPIARLLGRGMGCPLWIQHLIDILPEFLQSFMQYRTILDRVITTLDYSRNPLSWKTRTCLQSILQCQRQDCWWRGDTRSQDINSYGIHQLFPVYSRLSTWRINSLRPSDIILHHGSDGTWSTLLHSFN